MTASTKIAAADIKLRRNGNGGYTAYGERFAIRPVMIGQGANMNGGYSNGHREWSIVDLSERGLGTAKVSRLIRRTLWELRDLIAATLNREVEEPEAGRTAEAVLVGETFWTVADGEAREVELLEERGVEYLVRTVDTGAEFVTRTGLLDTKAEAEIVNFLR